MTPDEFADAVADRNETALSRLGSSKSLYADTRGEMEPEAVRAAAATAYHHAAAAFAAWADDESDEGAAETWTTAVDAAEDAAASIADGLDDVEPGEAPAPREELEAADDAVSRAGALYGWALAQEKKTGQATGFFVGRADPSTADSFRDVRSTLEELRERALDALADTLTDEEATDDALAAADAAIQAAYEEYVAALEELGVNPKPVC